MKKFAKGFKPAKTPMAFEYPFVPDYKAYRGGGTQAVDFDARSTTTGCGSTESSGPGRP